MLISTPRLCTCQRTFRYYRDTSSPCRSGTHNRGQRTWPTERPSCNSAKISRRRHPGSHPENYISAGHPATLAPDTRRSFLTFTILLVFYFFLLSKLQCSTSCCLPTNKSPEDATPQSSTHPVPVPEHPTTVAYSEQHCDSVTFATYALPCKN